MKSNIAGFSLLEIMAVVAIVSIMSMIVVNNYKLQKETRDVVFSAQRTADDVRRAQNYSINIKKHGNDDISGGYGIHFDKSSSSYVIFLDSGTKDKKYGAGDILVETVNLPANILVDDLNNGVSINSADIIFLPPYGKVYMAFDGGVPQTGVKVNVIIKRSGGSCPALCKTVSINSQGQVK